MTDGAPRNRWREAAGSAVLSFGVVLFEQALHVSRGAEASLSSRHLLIDSLLALPLAFLAVRAGRLCRTAWARAGLTASAFGASLIPAAGLHHTLHRDAATHAHAAVESFSVSHATVDAVIALPIAFLLARLINGFDRRWLVVGLASMMGLSTLPAAAAPTITPFAVPLPIPPVITDANITLTAAQTPVQILPGAPTTMWTYNGTFPGPTIRRPSGTPTTVTVANNLPASAGELTLHHHGNHSTSADDGQPHEELIATGGARPYTYDFMEGGAAERGAFQWYHDHRMDVTGRNVWMGLAGMVILDDPAEQAINDALPKGDRDVPLMIADRTFDDANQIPYAFTTEGKLGNAILVNGAPQPYFDVSDTKYRLRLLNASNIRSYTFSLSNGAALVQVANESGLLPVPVSRTQITLGPAERAEVVVDFAGALGTEVILRNAIGFGTNLSTVMQFRVVRDEADTATIPSTLRAAPTFLDSEPIVPTRTWLLGRDLHDGRWTINGKGFDHARIDAQPRIDTAERWIFANTTEVDHIVHIHDVDWRIVARTPTVPPGPDPVLGEDALRESFRIRPNEVIVVVSRFTDHLGKYVLHCHMLEHEDFSMMAQFEVVP